MYRANLLRGSLVFACVFSFLPFLPVAAAPTADLVGYWNFDEGSGTTAADSSGNGKNATLFNSPTWTAGRVGAGALQFDGVDDYLTVGGFSVGSSEYTIAGWVNTSASGVANYVLSQDKGSGVTRWFSQLPTSGGKIAFYTDAVGETAGGWKFSSGSAPSGSWFHFAIVGTPAATQFFINGSLAGSSAPAGNISSNNATLYLGYTSNFSYHLNGSLDDIRIYSRALSAGEISELYLYAGEVGTLPPSTPSPTTSTPSTPTPPTTPPPPSVDTTPPSISSVSSSGITTNAATISWVTNESSDTQVEYGLTTTYGNQTAVNPSLVTSHSASLATLSANTMYHYRVTSRDVSGNSAVSSDNTFSTNAVTPPPPLPPPTSNAPVCGNNITEPGEVCDRADVGGFSCTTVAAGFKSGSLSCAADCKSYNVSQCVAGNVINSASCESADVQSAIDSATEGDTVIVPAGNCSWNSRLTVKSVNINNKNLVLKGAGIGQTVITLANSSGYGDGLIGVNNSGKPVRVTGFTFKGQSNNNYIFIGGNVPNFRIDHVSSIVDNTNPPRLLFVSGASTGVIDHISSDGSLRTGGSLIRDVDISARMTGNIAWLQPIEFGTRNAVFFEDSTFFSNGPDGGFAVDQEAGSRTVFRYNTVRNQEWGSHGAMGSQSRGLFSYEIYNNTFVRDLSIWLIKIWPRGGTGVIYNNTFVDSKTASGGYNIGVDNPRSHTLYGTPFNSKCDGTSSWDGNQESNGYPCLGQIGRSTGNPGSETLVPLYEWNNTFNGADVDITVVNPPSDTQIREGRDYYNDTARPGYVAYPYPHPVALIEPLAANTGASPVAAPLVPISPTNPAVSPTTPRPADVPVTDPVVTVPPPVQCVATTQAFVRSLTIGSTGSDVKALQQFLNQKGFVVSLTGPGSRGNETAYFGPATARALGLFQASHGIIPAVGYFGPITMARVNSLSSGTAAAPCPTSVSTPVATASVSSSFTRDLTLGDTGSDVKALQQFLNQKGFVVSLTGPGSRGNETAYFGPATARALGLFQASHGIIPAVGYFGPKTRGKVQMLVK